MNRRALFTGLALAGVAAPALASQLTAEEMAFVQGIGLIHPNGRAAAVHALQLGLRPDELYQVDLISGAPTERPQLRFNRHDARRHVFVTPIDFHHEATGVTVARAI